MLGFHLSGTALDIARRKVTKQKKVDPDTGKVIKPEQRMWVNLQ